MCVVSVCVVSVCVVSVRSVVVPFEAAGEWEGSEELLPPTLANAAPPSNIHMTDIKVCVCGCVCVCLSQLCMSEGHCVSLCVCACLT